MSDRKPRNKDDTDDLAVLLDDLNATLSALEEAVDDEESSTRSSQAGQNRNNTSRDSQVRRTDTPQTDSTRGDDDGQSSIGNVFRFTEEYTLPALISVLETTIESLELLRGVLRFVDPEQSAFSQQNRRQNRQRRGQSPRRDPVSAVGREALSGLDRALSEIEETLAADNDQSLSSDRVPRDLLADARDLSAEVADRLGDAQNGSERRRERTNRGTSRNRPDATTRQEPQQSRDTTTTTDDGTQRNDTAVTINVDSPREDDGNKNTDPSSTTHPDSTTMDENSSSDSESGSVDVDVESELASIKDTVDPDERFIDTDADSDAASDNDDDDSSDNI
ncbi:hypothetical protein [Haloquadratum walsbyi]|jgi:hypothetical protein|uniref:Uncharacterized protein n=1 Tax=Haloquadratum walsbyi J07HQW2 TaxID=1238425 RepID=U1PS44_9EURY|nr:hypothetical protein [Haloquadratum walsbyi]ERG96607.1 MAG: hypothetical protein J07HQW2_03087 [Haloquadratum walsbyi J07HQW2]